MKKSFAILIFCLGLILLKAASLPAAPQDRNLFSKRGEKVTLGEKEEAIAIKDPSLINIPSEIGSVTEQFLGDSDFFIVHIQDAHCNSRVCHFCFCVWHGTTIAGRNTRGISLGQH